MSAKWLFCLIAMVSLPIACQEAPQEPGKKPGSLEEARTVFRQGDWAKAGSLFTACVAALANKDQAGAEEARLGLIACEFLADSETWKEKLSQWQPVMGYYWAGKFLMPTEGLSKASGDHFNLHLPAGNPARASFLLLHFLLSEKQLRGLSRLIVGMEKCELAWEYCLAWGWELVRAGQYPTARSVFSLLTVPPRKVALPYADPHFTVTDKQRAEAACGIVAASILEKGSMVLAEHDLPRLATEWKYPLERNEIDMLRASSPLHQYAQPLAAVPFGLARGVLLLSDVLFVAGTHAPNRIYIWERGTEFLRANASHFAGKNAELTAAHAALLYRFELGIAWEEVTAGHDAKARQIFQTFATAPQLVSWNTEAKLGLALLAWKGEATLDEMKDLVPVSRWPGYFLGGREVSFYRLVERKNRETAIENLIKKEPAHRSYLILLDALCLVGDGRAAYQVLAKVAAQFADSESQQVYFEEQANIPKDVYAQNQIWEKLD